MKSPLSPSLKLAVVLLVFGVAWILFYELTRLKGSGNAIQFYKDLLFVIAAAALVFLVSRRLTKTIEKANKEQDDALQRFNILGMATKDAVWDYNINTGECYTNQNLQEMFGYSPEELKDNYSWWTNNLHPNDRERVIRRLDNMLQTGGSEWQDEYRFRCLNGEYKVIYDRGFIMRDKENKPFRLIGAMQDVSILRMLK